METSMKIGNVNGIAPASLITQYGTNSNDSIAHTQSRCALQALQLLEEGKFQAALPLLNICLGDPDETDASNLDTQVEDLIKNAKYCKPAKLTTEPDACNTDESSLIEKRCLVNMILKRYSKVVQDAKKMLDFSGENPVAYKCLLIALCKMKKLEQANEVIKLWQKNSPRDLEMVESRTKLEGLMMAVKNGIEASDAFSDLEDLLGLNFDWLLSRKSKDPQWKYRPLPTSSRCSFVLCLQYRFGHCSLGEKCPDAHGEGELEEWKKRYEIENVSRKISNLKVDDGSTYIKDLLTIVQSGNTSILSENDSEQIRISCVSPLHTTVQQRKFRKFTWKFSVKTLKPLTYVCLLHEHHRQYFHISSCTFVGPNDSIILNQSGKWENNSQVIVPQLSEAALAIAGGNVNSYAYKIKVVFTPEVYGNFRQTVVFDIGDKVKFARNVSVDVVPPPDSDLDGSKNGNDNSASPVDRSKGFRNNVPWNFGNADMVDGNTGEKMPSEKLGFALIGGSFSAKAETFMENTKDPLSKDHYKERMRFLLTQEERSRQEILAKYNVTTNVHLSEKYIVTGGYNEGMARYAVDGTLFGRINLFRDISEDTAVGRLILRSCNAVLLTKSEESRRSEFKNKIRVYFCPVSDKTKNSVFLDIGRTCVTELGLKDGDIMQFDIQFQLDRTAFIEQKKVIDQLSEKHLDMLFPDLAINCNIPWSPIKQWSEIEASGYRLNPKQKEALIAITAENCRTPPILVIGPFGSGKTFTLAQCIRKILTQNNTRVMVCTHSNSAADLYIKEYLDSWVKEGFSEARPLRIYYEMRNLSSVHPVVLQYCTIEAMKFRPPTYEEVLNHRVIVVTLSTSYLLMEMKLPEDTFSHILLDEAAQAMESEAITPLMSAGRNTKLVLAGDHFQLSPELFSEEARNIHPSLLERLHALYPDTHPCKLMLCENYRSHSAIIQFVSESFYTKKLECAKSQPVHDTFFPLTFFAARGEDVQDSESTSYYNMAEVFELTEKISELISSWPEKWGDYRDENAIGVLTPYADQVSRIRSRLRKKGLHSVSVERVFNVQGKQFRAVFLSTVRTFRPWVRILPEAVGNEVDLGFFSSPKLLNTALTRAQSLVAVVGDPVSLCSVGKCRRIWEDYIRICHESKSLFGITFLQLKQSILGVEMRLTWGLNPLANEFQPQQYFNRLSATTVANQSSVPAPVAVSNIHSTCAPPVPTHVSYQYNKPRPRSQVYVEQPSGYYPPQQNFPEGPPMLPPSGGHVHNPIMYPGTQQSMYMRPPAPGGVGIVPAYTPYVQPPVAVVPWNQNVPPTPTPGMQVPNIPQNMQVTQAVVPAPVNVRSAGQPRVPQYPPAPVPVVHPPFPSHAMHGGSGSQPIPYGNLNGGLTSVNNEMVVVPPNNQNFNAKNSSLTQQHYAAGQPLFRRPAASSNAPPPTVSAMQQMQSSYEERLLQSSQAYQLHDHQLLHGHQNQPKLTPEEITIISRALEQQASSGEPFSGDLQSLRMKFIQAINSGEITTNTRLAQHQSIQQPLSNFQGHSIEPNMSQNYHQGLSVTAGNTVIPPNNVFTPIPHKSPAASIPSDRSVFNNAYPESTRSAPIHNRVWQNPNASFPSLNEGVNIHAHSSHGMHPHQGQIHIPNDRGQPYIDHNSRPLYNHQAANAPIGMMNNPPQQVMPRPVCGPNNNTLPYHQTNEYGYHADVGGGLKAQLSGGIRQGFGERSAFSRVHDSQDMDIIPDTSGLGRSYANVVKAAVTTAAVGAGVPSSTMSMASSISRSQVPPSVPVPSHMYPNPSLSTGKFYGNAAAPLHHHYSGSGP